MYKEDTKLYFPYVVLKYNVLYESESKLNSYKTPIRRKKLQCMITSNVSKAINF